MRLAQAYCVDAGDLVSPPVELELCPGGNGNLAQEGWSVLSLSGKDESVAPVVCLTRSGGMFLYVGAAMVLASDFGPFCFPGSSCGL